MRCERPALLPGQPNPCREKRPLNRLRILLAVSLALLSSLAHAQAGDPSKAEPLREIQVAPEAFVRGAPVPAWADLLPLPPEDPALPASPLVVRLADSHLRAGPPQAYLVNRAEQAREASALGAIGQPQLAFNPQYQRLLLHRVQVVRGGEVIDHTPTVRVRFLQRETGLEQGIYSGVITAALLLEDVRVGDTLHLVYSVEGDNPVFAGRYADAASWEQNVPTQWRRVTLTAPEGQPMHWRWVGGTGAEPPAPTQDRISGLQRWRFEQRNLPAAPIEPHMPARVSPLRWLQFSAYGSWDDVAAWARPLFPPDAPLPASLEPLLATWRALPSRAAQVSQALQWVQGEIRYWSVALGEGSHRPALPLEVVQRRFGDCKDKSLLLVQILRALGLPAEPALASLSTRDGPSALLPSPLVFDHVVVRTELDGRAVYIDPTRIDQAGDPARMGQHLEGATVLPIGSPGPLGSPVAGPSALQTVVSPAREETFLSTLTERIVLERFDGEALLQAEQLWTGLQAEGLRSVLATLDADRRRQFLLGTYEQRYPGIRLDGEPVFNDDPEANRIVVRASYRVPKFAREAPEAWGARFFPSNLQGSFVLPEQVSGRRHPLALPAWPMTLRYTLELRWPERVAAVFDPETTTVDGRHFRAEVQRSFRGNNLRVAIQLKPRVGELPAAELPQLMQDLERFQRAVGGVVGVPRSMLKQDGFLGIGRSTLQDRMRQRLQTAVERSGKVIDAGRLEGEDLAGVLCRRAESLADLGRAAEGLSDAERAVQIAPGFGDALTCRGNVRWALGDFAAAAADFTEALSLDADGADLLARRARARFFEGRYAQAAADLAKAVPMREDASARLFLELWQALVHRRGNLPLPPGLQAAAATDPDGTWPRPALAMLAGLRSPQQVLQRLETGLKGDERELALAEAWFYIGELHLAEGRTDEARAAFESARRQEITMYIEHVAAGHELKRMAR